MCLGKRRGSDTRGWSGSRRWRTVDRGTEAIEPSTALCLSRRKLRSLVGDRQAIYVKILETAVDILSHRLTERDHTPH